MRRIKYLLIGLIGLLFTVVLAQGGVVGTVYQTTNVRQGPDTRFEIVGQLSAGDQVPITGQDATGHWLQVTLTDGTSGWLPAFAVTVTGALTDLPVIDEALSATAEAGAGVTVVSYGRVNLRSGPGISYGIVAQMDVNDRADVVARSNRSSDWLLIRFNQQEGWVAYFTVTVEGDPGGLPVLVPDSSGDNLIPPSRLLKTRFNVRLHDEPQLDASVVITIPFDSQVTPLGRSTHGVWLFVGYNGETGWGVAQLFDITSAELMALPVYAQDITPTPAATAEPSS